MKQIEVVGTKEALPATFYYTNSVMTIIQLSMSFLYAFMSLPDVFGEHLNPKEVSLEEKSSFWMSLASFLNSLLSLTSSF